MLDVECAARGTPESYVLKVRHQHKHNGRLFEPKCVTSSDVRTFGIQHFAGRVVYDASDCLGKIFFFSDIKKNGGLAALSDNDIHYLCIDS